MTRLVAISALMFIVLACSTDIETALRCPDCHQRPVSQIVDGDTFHSGGTKIRIYGIDTPERGQKCYSEATKRLRELAGDAVRTENGPRLADRFGRSLAYVFTSNGMSIDEILIREGLAHAWKGDGHHRDHLVDVEREARESNRGCLW